MLAAAGPARSALLASAGPASTTQAKAPALSALPCLCIDNHNRAARPPALPRARRGVIFHRLGLHLGSTRGASSLPTQARRFCRNKLRRFHQQKYGKDQHDFCTKAIPALPLLRLHSLFSSQEKIDPKMSRLESLLSRRLTWKKQDEHGTHRCPRRARYESARMRTSAAIVLRRWFCRSSGGPRAAGPPQHEHRRDSRGRSEMVLSRVSCSCRSGCVTGLALHSLTGPRGYPWLGVPCLVRAGTCWASRLQGRWATSRRT